VARRVQTCGMIDQLPSRRDPRLAVCQPLAHHLLVP